MALLKRSPIVGKDSFFSLSSKLSLSSWLLWLLESSLMLKISRVQQKPLKTRLHCFLVDAATALLPSYVSMGNKVLDAWLHQQFVVRPRHAPLLLSSFLLGKQEDEKRSHRKFNFISPFLFRVRNEPCGLTRSNCPITDYSTPSSNWHFHYR